MENGKFALITDVGQNGLDHIRSLGSRDKWTKIRDARSDGE
jgi:hypothetical protein